MYISIYLSILSTFWISFLLREFRAYYWRSVNGCMLYRENNQNILDFYLAHFSSYLVIGFQT